MPVNKLKPTQSEIEILQILWKLEVASVRQVHALLEHKKKTGYTSTLKLLQLMYEKGFVLRDDSKKVHYYKPSIKKETVRKEYFNNLLENFFGDNKASLVMHALGTNTKISKEELQAIQEFLKKKN
ncbi:MAG: BlaI/MecI/CopY family transcriptional regulator [Chitinophagaceae bacterium]